jgi:peroxiredoxin
MHHSCKLSQVFLLCLSDDLPFTVLFLSSLHQISKLLIHQTKRNDYILHNFSIITMYSGSVVKTKI